jgi:hypothetical protein
LAAVQTRTEERLPWWKRIFRRKNKNKTYKAGERRKRKDGTRKEGGSAFGRALRKLPRVLMYLLPILILVALIGPWRQSIFDGVRKTGTKVKNFLVANYQPVHPSGAEASTALSDGPASNAIDGATNTAWKEADPGDGVGQKLILTFESPVDLDRIGFHSGVSDQPDEFLAQPRPHELHLAFSDGSAKDVTLKDSPNFQTFKVKARHAVRVEITVQSVYTSYKGGHDCGIAEVELFTRA